MGSNPRRTVKRAGVAVAPAPAPSRVQASRKTAAKVDPAETSRRAIPVRSSPFAAPPPPRAKVAIVTHVAAVPAARARTNDAALGSNDMASCRAPAVPLTPVVPRRPAKFRKPTKARRPANARTPAKAKAAPPFARKAVIQELEPRLLLSADLNPAAPDTLLATPAMQGAEYRPLVEPGSQPIVTSMEVAPIQRTNELVFVDTATHDYQRL